MILLLKAEILIIEKFQQRFTLKLQKINFMLWEEITFRGDLI